MRTRRLRAARWVVFAGGLSAAHCFHRFPEDEAPPARAGSAGTESGGEGGESTPGRGGDSAGRGSGGSAGGSPSSGGKGGSDGGTPAMGGSGAMAGGAMGGTNQMGGTSAMGGRTGTGGSAATAGDTNGGSTMIAGSAGLEGSAGSEPSDAGAGGEGSGLPPQCEEPAGTLRTVFSDGFESYPAGSPPYELGTPSWVRAVEGADARISEGSWVASGLRSFLLKSYTTRSEVAYVGLGLHGPPRRIVLEFRYSADAGVVFLDFAEVGLGIARSKFDLVPSVALEVNDHVLELRANPDKPQASTNGKGSVPAATKPPFVVLFNEVEHLSTPVHNHFRFDFDFCTGTVGAYVGTAANPPFRGSGAFDGSRAVDVLYLAGGLNDTYLDEISVQADDE